MLPKVGAASIPNLVALSPCFRLRRIPNFVAVMGSPNVANLTVKEQQAGGASGTEDGQVGNQTETHS